MAGYRVDPDVLRSGDAALAQTAAHARGAVDRLRTGAEELFADGWHSPAAVVFRHGWAQWLAAAYDMLAALEAMAALLGAAGAGYADSDAEVRAAIAATPT